MTEKRFAYIKNSSITQYQSIPIQKIGKGKPFHCQGLVDELNKLYNENEELKRQIGNLEHTKDFCADVCADCERLEKENEQLKKQIHQLQHWNKCLAEKRHQELPYKPYTASKSEKELKELLEPKLFNCSDR